jgi:hypothetical protein
MSHVEYIVNAAKRRTEGMTMNGIGLNGRWSLNGSGVKLEMKAWNGSALRPLNVSMRL